jgi:hypothetical protein
MVLPTARQSPACPNSGQLHQPVVMRQRSTENALISTVNDQVPTHVLVQQAGSQGLVRNTLFKCTHLQTFQITA